MRLNLDALSMPIVNETYNVEVNNRFEVLKPLDEDYPSNELSNEFRGAILHKLGEVLRNVPKKNRRPWI